MVLPVISLEGGKQVSSLSSSSRQGFHQFQNVWAFLGVWLRETPSTAGNEKDKALQEQTMLLHLFLCASDHPTPPTRAPWVSQNHPFQSATPLPHMHCIPVQDSLNSAIL